MLTKIIFGIIYIFFIFITFFIFEKNKLSFFLIILWTLLHAIIYYVIAVVIILCIILSMQFHPTAFVPGHLIALMYGALVILPFIFNPLLKFKKINIFINGLSIGGFIIILINIFFYICNPRDFHLIQALIASTFGLIIFIADYILVSKVSDFIEKKYGKIGLRNIY